MASLSLPAPILLGAGLGTHVLMRHQPHLTLIWSPSGSSHLQPPCPTCLAGFQRVRGSLRTDLRPQDNSLLLTDS